MEPLAATVDEERVAVDSDQPFDRQPGIAGVEPGLGELQGEPANPAGRGREAPRGCGSTAG